MPGEVTALIKRPENFRLERRVVEDRAVEE